MFEIDTYHSLIKLGVKMRMMMMIRKKGSDYDDVYGVAMITKKWKFSKCEAQDVNIDVLPIRTKILITIILSCQIRQMLIIEC